MGFELSGKLFKKFETKQVTERFRKREFVVELPDDRYPQTVLFQLTGNRCDRLDDIEEGEEIDLEFSLRGREWTSPKGEVKYFNSLDVWSVERRRGADDRFDSPPPTDEPPVGFSDDDIPF